MTDPEPIILLAHGSRDPRHRRGIEALAGRAALLGEAPVHVAYLEHHAPTAADAARAAGGGVVVPALLSTGYHARVDVPEAIEAMHRAVPGTFLASAGLGLGRPVLEGVGELLARAGVVESRDLTVVLTLAGTSAPEAIEELRGAVACAAAAPDRPAWVDRGCVCEPAHLGSVAARAAEGVPTLVVPIALCEGVLRDRVVEAAFGLGLATVAGVLAETEAIAHLVVARAAEALAVER